LQRAERRIQRGEVPVADELGERAPREGSPLDRGPLHDGPFHGREAVDAGGEHRLDGRGHVQLLAVLGLNRQQLLEEERVALRRLQRALTGLLVDDPGAQRPFEQRRRLALGQRLEAHHRRVVRR
jgi:hypothetical protein